MERAAGILRHQRIKFAVLSRNARAQERKQAMVGFRKGKIKLLLATDLAGRGLDLIKLPAVINFEVPRTATAYIHRAGRTGRMGNPGTVITMGDDHDFRDLKKLVPQYAVERAYVGNHGLTTERPVSEADEQPRAKKRQTKEQANTRVRATAGDAGKQPRLQDAVTGVVAPQKKAHKKNRARNRKNKGKPKK
jgi:superfamily II DNA/RNA helicase